jgi:hypothetical protein
MQLTPQARTIVVVTAVALAGCRGLPWVGVLPTAHEVPAEQLVFHSDFDLSNDHRLVRELTAERDDIYQPLGLPPSTEPIDVYLFHDAEEYGRHLARYFPLVPSRRAFFLETDTRLAIYSQWSDRVAEDLRHEVAHGYLHAAVPSVPLWLDEGLAEYFEVPRGQGGLNRPHLDLLLDMIQRDGWQPDLQRLEGLAGAAELDQRGYAEAWAWVYYLLHTGPEQRELLTNYLAELRVHGSAEPLSVRLASLHVEPQRTLIEYLTTLKE